MKTFIYGLTDPRTGRVRYVGKSDNPERRYRSHFWRQPGSHKVHWLAEMKRLDILPGLVILEEVELGVWQEAEQRWIAHFGRTPLVNGTDGGDGGENPSKEALAKQSAAKKGNRNAQGHTLSLAERMRQAKRAIEQWTDPDKRARLIAARKAAKDRMK